MHYYQFNIADYRKDTRHLTRSQRDIYRELIDTYYLEENPLGFEWVTRRLRLDIEEDINDLKIVLNDFFFEENGLWRHRRIDSEIDKYREMCDRNTKNSKKGGRPKQPPEPNKTDWVSSGNQSGFQKKPTRIPNHKPITNNHKPITNNQDLLNTKAEKIPPHEILPWEDGYIDLDEKMDLPVVPEKKISKPKPKKPDDVDQDVWDDWVAHRNKKKSAVSDTAIRGARKVAQEVGMSLNEVLTQWVMSGWTGIKADWLRKDEGTMSKAGERNKAILSALTRGASDGKVISMMDASKAPWLAANVAKKIESGG